MFNGYGKSRDRTGANAILLPWILTVYASLILFAGSGLWRNSW
jgi:hypothetical protein